MRINPFLLLQLDASEKIIGTWKNKPLYGKIFQFSMPKNTDGVVNFNFASNIKSSIILGGFLNNSDWQNIPLPFFASSNGNQTKCWIESGKLFALNQNETYNDKLAEIIIIYTKTTD